MMENILLVLAVTEGRRFPKRPHHHIVVEASFDGEVLCTDMIRHRDNPKFNTELAWEIDKKSLHQHRLQRTPLKIQVYAVDDASMKKELIGYCLLDLRTAHENEQKRTSWHTLLGSKYQQVKPEIKTSLSIEVDKVKKDEIKEEPAKKVEPIINDPEIIDVVLDEEKGYYLIGPENNECEIFVLSVSVGGARNLMKLLPSNANVNVEDGFYFYYSLLDNDVTNETFYDLMVSSMPTERATVRISTTPQRLVNYIRKKRVIEVYFCSSAATLGKATISLEPLITTTIDKRPSKVEGLFPLVPSSSSSSSGEVDCALVGVSVALRKESQEVAPNLNPLNPNWELKDDIPTTIVESKIPSSAARTPQKELFEKPKVENVSPKKKPPPLYSSPCGEEKSRHFIFSVDIRSISNMDVHQPVYCLCRYTYPFFGSSAPILTNPPVLVHRNSEVLLPQSFCKFEFASTTKLLRTTLTRVPLIIEVWTKDDNIKDQLFGIAQVNLSNVLDGDNEDTLGNPIIKSEKVPVVYADKPGKKVALIHIVLGFEDKGIITAKLPVKQNTAEKSLSNTGNTSEVPSSVDNHGGPRATQEYQVAMALELWRQQQEEHFKNELTSKENECMKAIAEEWKQRDLERELLVKKKLEEYQSLESKLKKTLEELEGREKQVLEFDEQLQRKEKLLEDEYQRKGIELTESSRRLKEEFSHQLLLEKKKYSDLEQRSKRIEDELLDTQKQLKERGNELFSLKESLVNRPDVKLQADMNMLLLEKSEMERKIESITKSKIHYKQQWGRALRELARIKLCEQEAAKTRLKKQQDELDHMKLRFLAAEEKQVIKSEKEEFKEVRDEINKKLEELQSAVEISKQQVKETVPQAANESEDMNKTRIAKLIEERDTLLQTGVYSVDDRVISQLDQEIRQLIHVNG